MANMGVCVVDRDRRVLPRGQRGELCLFGRGVARGYLNQPELTDARFVTITLPDGTTHRMYLTGDEAVVECVVDASVETQSRITYLGRHDTQIKFHGIRIELSEIEDVLSQFEQVQRAVVSRVDSAVGARLVGYAMLRTGYAALDHSALRAYLAQRLPAYMQPEYVVALDALPLNAAGKLDRTALPAVVDWCGPTQTRPPKTPTEQRLARLVRDIRGDRFTFGVRDCLSSLGFDSLELAVFLSKIEVDFNIVLDVAVDADVDTLETVALMVDATARSAVAVKSDTVARRSGDRTKGPEASKLAGLLRPHLASWPGLVLGRHGLVRHLPSSAVGIKPVVFWCFQSGPELAALSEALGQEADLFGLRSGHLVLDYDARTLGGLAATYADEVERVCGDHHGHRAGCRSVVLGGNCQGGLIMAEVSKELRRRGLAASLTVLMEQGRFTPVAGPVLLLFGDRSYLNPYAYLSHPAHLFGMAYPDGYHIEMLPGGHGQYFGQNNVKVLAGILLRHIKDIDTHG